MGKHAGQRADEPGRDLFWDENRDAQSKANNFDAYDERVSQNPPDDGNPYSKEKFGK